MRTKPEVSRATSYLEHERTGPGQRTPSSNTACIAWRSVFGRGWFNTGCGVTPNSPASRRAPRMHTRWSWERRGFALASTEVTPPHPRGLFTIAPRPASQPLPAISWGHHTHALSHARLRQGLAMSPSRPSLWTLLPAVRRTGLSCLGCWRGVATVMSPSLKEACYVMCVCVMCLCVLRVGVCF
mgnify:CR=1 FL=1